MNKNLRQLKSLIGLQKCRFRETMMFAISEKTRKDELQNQTTTTNINKIQNSISLSRKG